MDKAPINSFKDLCKLIKESDFATIKLEVQNGKIVFVSKEDKYKSNLNCADFPEVLK